MKTFLIMILISFAPLAFAGEDPTFDVIRNVQNVNQGRDGCPQNPLRATNLRGSSRYDIAGNQNDGSGITGSIPALRDNHFNKLFGPASSVLPDDYDSDYFNNGLPSEMLSSNDLVKCSFDCDGGSYPEYAKKLIDEEKEFKFFRAGQMVDKLGSPYGSDYVAMDINALSKDAQLMTNKDSRGTNFMNIFIPFEDVSDSELRATEGVPVRLKKVTSGYLRYDSMNWYRVNGKLHHISPYGTSGGPIAPLRHRLPNGPMTDNSLTTRAAKNLEGQGGICIRFSEMRTEFAEAATVDVSFEGTGKPNDMVSMRNQEAKKVNDANPDKNCLSSDWGYYGYAVTTSDRCFGTDYPGGGSSTVIRDDIPGEQIPGTKGCFCNGSYPTVVCYHDGADRRGSYVMDCRDGKEGILNNVTPVKVEAGSHKLECDRYNVTVEGKQVNCCEPGVKGYAGTPIGLACERLTRNWDNYFNADGSVKDGSQTGTRYYSDQQIDFTVTPKK